MTDLDKCFDDLGYVTGSISYDDVDMDYILPNRAYNNYVRRGINQMYRLTMEGISYPVDSFLNYDY